MITSIQPFNLGLGIAGAVGIIIVLFSFIFGIFGLLFFDATKSSPRKKIFFRYFSAIIIISLLSIFALHESNLSGGGIVGGVYNNDNYYQMSISVFLMLMAYGAFIGAAFSFIGLLVGTIWPPFIFRKTRGEVIRYWGTIFLSLLVIGVFSWSGESIWNSYARTIPGGTPVYGGGYNPPCVSTPGEVPCMPEPVADKPVIYLYPTHPENVSVTLNYAGALTTVYPAFDTGTTWNVTAYPDGELINQNDDKQYSYLFWEGEDNHQYNLSTGFVVKGSDTASFLQNQLAAMGLTPREYNEMIAYWLPKMQDNPYNLIHFAGGDYTNIAKLTIIPKPDSLLRVFMVWEPLQTTEQIQPQTFPNFTRNGFTVVEWGGTEL
ncbi:MAG TPA: hypothetical protein VMR99_02270 [Candidatus Paceibacterota bacterium]|nr:hypothetical protein [Candidatus Paceibacterota bacterium]